MASQFRSIAGTLKRLVVALLSALRQAGVIAWRLARGPVMFVFNVIAALIILFEEWGWRPLEKWLGKLADYRPIAAVERWIAGLPPYGALCVFALPTTFLLPLKFVAVWLLANGQVFAASALFVAAKIASTALLARIFMLTKPALMQIAWFADAYAWFIPWKDALFAVIRSSWVWRSGRIVKYRTMAWLKPVFEVWRPRLDAAIRRSGVRLRDVSAAARSFGGTLWNNVFRR